MSGSNWRAAALIRLALTAACWPALSYAGAVDEAVQAVATVGRIAGVPITQADKPIVQALLSCAMEHRQMLDCSRQVAVLQLPGEAQPIAQCVLRGAQFNDCGAPELLRQVPISARAATRCIKERSAIGTCAELIAISAVQRHAFQVIDKLRADGRYDAEPAASAALRSLIGLAEGLRDDDWDKAALHGGPEVYQVAAKANSKLRGGQAQWRGMQPRHFE